MIRSETCLLKHYKLIISPLFQNFSPNPYFEDTKLTKTITFLDEGTTKITATSIKWKEGMVRFRYMLLVIYLYVYLQPSDLVLYVYIKGLSNGVTHEKNGNKRPHEEDRLVKCIYLFCFVFFIVVVGLMICCHWTYLFIVFCICLALRNHCRW